MVIVPVAALLMSTLLIGFDSLIAKPANAPAGKEVSLQTPPVVASPTAVPSMSPVAQPSVKSASVSPAPRATTAASRAGNLLNIPAIGLNASVVNVGVTASNAIDVPAGLQVGYWTGSARPGTPGATFLDGHVDGIFAHLHKLTAGQTFSVRFNGQIFRYQIAHTETVALAGIDMNRALSTYGGATEGLNMMTCAGNYMPSIGTYDQRFVVYAVRIA